MTTIVEGKTKIISSTRVVRLHVKDDITAGDGKKHDILPGKGALSTRTICNNFELLRACGIPVAYYCQDSLTSFLAPECTMLKWEVVVRGEAHGSYLVMFPGTEKGRKFNNPLSQLYLKTSDKRWKTHTLPCDDPMVLLSATNARLFNPKEKVHHNPFLTLPVKEVFTVEAEDALLRLIDRVAIRAFEVLRWGLFLLGRRLVDIKFEFGVDPEGRLRLADDVDNGSWRVLDGAGNYVDKQGYRDGYPLEKVLASYKHVADLTDRFREPAFQQTVRCLHETSLFSPIS